METTEQMKMLAIGGIVSIGGRELLLLEQRFHSLKSNRPIADHGRHSSNSQ